MQPVDESVRFVEFVTKAGHPAPGNHSSVTLYSPRAAFSRFHPFRDFVHVGVQRLQQLGRLRRVRFIDHVGIIASTPTMRAPSSDRQTGSSDVVP
jgi:phosphate-selective porin